MRESAAAESPCTGVCRISLETLFCDGCFRTVDEIGSWSDLDDEARREVLERIAVRRSARSSS